MDANPSFGLTMVAIFSAWCGMGGHILKRNVEGESWEKIKKYVHMHLKTIIISALFATGAGIGVLAMLGPDVWWVAVASGAFTAGWTGDSGLELARKHKEMGL